MTASSDDPKTRRRSSFAMNLFRAPAAARAAKTLDRSLFSRSLPTAAASVRDNRLLAAYRRRLEKTREVLLLDRFDPISLDPDPVLAAQGKKCLVLKPEVKPDGSCLPAGSVPRCRQLTWLMLQRLKLGARICERRRSSGTSRWFLLMLPLATSCGAIVGDIPPFLSRGALQLLIELLLASGIVQELTRAPVDVIRSILPEELHGEIPVGFNTAGHVGTFNISFSKLAHSAPR